MSSYVGTINRLPIPTHLPIAIKLSPPELHKSEQVVVDRAAIDISH